MKLVLFSDLYYLKTCEVGIKLINLIGKSNPTIGYISSCPDPSRKFYDEVKKYYSQFEATLSPYIDLEEGFDNNDIELIFQADAIHLSGGNTYRFLYWILKRGLHKKLDKYVKSGGVLIGVSAGSIIMTPDISSSELCGDENNIDLKDYRGLSLVSFHFVPHAIQGEKVAEEIILKSKQDLSAIVMASDYDWIIVNKAQCEIYGQPKLVVDGKVVNITSLNSIDPQRKYLIIQE